MTEEEFTKEEFLRYYWQIKHYLESDINAMKRCDEKGSETGCGPYLLTTCSGIDILGTLSDPNAPSGKALKHYSGRAFKYYVKKFLGTVNPIYKSPELADFIYEFIRNGQVHEAVVKPRVVIYKNEKYHLKILSIARSLSDPTNRKEVVYFNPKMFADEFLNSLKHFQELFKDDTKIKKMATRLSELRNLALTSLKDLWPDLEEIKINHITYDELYKLGSLAPNGKGGARSESAELREDFWEILHKS